MWGFVRFLCWRCPDFSIWIKKNIFLTQEIIKYSVYICWARYSAERWVLPESVGNGCVSKMGSVCDKCLPLCAAEKSKSPHSTGFKPTPFVPVVSRLFGGCSSQISRSCREPGLHLFCPRILCVQNGGLEGKWCVFFWSNPLIKARLALPM